MISNKQLERKLTLLQRMKLFCGHKKETVHCTIGKKDHVALYFVEVAGDNFYYDFIVRRKRVYRIVCHTVDYMSIEQRASHLCELFRAFEKSSNMFLHYKKERFQKFCERVENAETKLKEGANNEQKKDTIL